VHRTAADYAYAELQAEMLAGHFLPGTPILESEWARKLEMSVTPVREALRRLEADGLVVRRHHRDVRVRQFSLAEARAVYQLRAVLEPMAAVLAARALGPREREELAHMVEEQRQALEAGTDHQIELLNNYFHRRIGSFAQNPLLEEELARLWLMVPIIRAVAWQRHLERRWETVVEHTAVVEAMLAHDLERALEVSREHVLRAWRNVEETFKAALERRPDEEVAEAGDLGVTDLLARRTLLAKGPDEEALFPRP
jgi:DNA-binding GntR family transcriptional regulator